MKKYRMVSLDTASQNTGWAYYEAGKLKDSGVISSSGDMEIRLNDMCYKIINLLNKLKPGTIVIELTVVDRGTGTQRVLSEIVGAVRGWAACHKYDDGINVEFIQYRPSTWRRLVCDEGEKAPTKRNDCKKWSVAKIKKVYNINVTDDRADAILIGQARINEVKEYLQELSEETEDIA